MIELRKETKTKSSLESFLVPRAWDLLCKVAKKMESDSKTLKLGHLIHKCSKILSTNAIITDNDPQYNRARQLKELYEDNWHIEVSSRVLKNMKRTKLGKEIKLPR